MLKIGKQIKGGYKYDMSYMPGKLDMSTIRGAKLEHSCINCYHIIGNRQDVKRFSAIRHVKNVTLVRPKLAASAGGHYRVPTAFPALLAYDVLNEKSTHGDENKQTRHLARAYLSRMPFSACGDATCVKSCMSIC